MTSTPPNWPEIAFRVIENGQIRNADGEVVYDLDVHKRLAVRAETTFDGETAAAMIPVPQIVLDTDPAMVEITARDALKRLIERAAADRCELPPEGWRCSRNWDDRAMSEEEAFWLWEAEADRGSSIPWGFREVLVRRGLMTSTAVLTVRGREALAMFEAGERRG